MNSLNSELRSRSKVIFAFCLAVLIFVSFFKFYGYNNTWGLFNIPYLTPHFTDLRTITGGAASFAQGLDPMVNNPGDPWGRRMNYPRIWQSLYLFGVNQDHTTYLGIIFICLFLVGIILILPNTNYTTLLFVMLAVLSPATLLGIERGNIDLLMFFLVALSVFSIRR